MKALTLTQPWATLVAVGCKQVETRSWGTHYRGPIAIHAAKGLGPVGGKQGLTDVCDSEPFFTALRPHLSGYTARERAANLPLGAIVATGTIVACVPTRTIREALAKLGYDADVILHQQERAFGDYSPGRYAWLLDRILQIHDPIECKGALGLWDIPPDVQEQIDLVDLDRLS